nr:immunoglobulin light chain junction region [Macaca mulatta]MOX58345.1 immunoglobulin light chain junction region [Macaca mulatta]
CQQYNRLPFTF